MRKKHQWLITLTLFVFMIVLTACSGGTDEKGNQAQSETGGQQQTGGTEVKPPAPNQSTPPEVKVEPAEIIFYTNNGDSEESFNYRFGDSIRKKFPQHTIKFIQSKPGTTLPELITTGERFDVFFQSIGNFEAQAFPYAIESDMTDLIKKHNVDLGKIEQSVVNAVIQASGGKMYGLPVFTNNMVLYYNKDLFDKFGEDYPTDGMTWDDINNLSRKMTRVEDGIHYYGFTHSTLHSVRMNQLSIPTADLKTDTPLINSDERWRKFYQTFYIDPMQGSGYLEGALKLNRLPIHSDFVNDKNVATFNYLSSLIYVWEEQMKAVNFDIVSMPTYSDMPKVGSQSYPSYFGITKMAKSPDAAMEVLKYMVSEELQAELSRKGIMPVLENDEIKKEMGKESPYSHLNWGAIFYNDFAPIPEKPGYDAALVSIIGGYGTQVALGKLDLNTALRTAEEESKKKIEEYKSQNQ